ncbi:helix-turn-helix domain-containing protein [Candidatus Pacearchaeota archaeon]|nr:helix-turn-helix domain-containing protein [Candidatus Pacearchaeota archaeon]
MAECFKCGVSDERAILFDAISSRGIVKVCRRCSIVEEIPIIRTPKPEEDNRPKPQVNVARNPYARPQKQEDVTLRNIVERNFKQNLKEDFSLKNSLIMNFHWVIMRARRARKMTQEQLAKALREPEIAIKTLEIGYVPEKSLLLIKKIEQYLGIRLRKPEKGADNAIIRADFNLIQDAKISDVKDMPPPSDDDYLDLSKGK